MVWFAARFNRLLTLLLAAASWLTPPIVLLLFLQWPLREYVGSISRQANDIGQWLFALLIAASVTAATRARVHLAADSFARHYSRNTRRRIRVAATLLALIPWAAFVLVASRTQVLASLQQREAFPDTLNPGYFIIKLAIWVLTSLMLVQACLDLLDDRNSAAGDRDRGERL